MSQEPGEIDSVSDGQCAEEKQKRMDGGIMATTEMVAFCQRRIAEEEALANQALSPVDAASHYQLALPYKAQLKILLRGPREQSV